MLDAEKQLRLGWVERRAELEGGTRAGDVGCGQRIQQIRALLDRVALSRLSFEAERDEPISNLWREYLRWR